MGRAVATASSGGVGLFSLLTVAFVVLKLTGYITWSWVWVLAPTWIPLAIFFFIVLMLVVLAAFK